MALADLHQAANTAEQRTIATEVIQQFIEEHGLRDGQPGADVRVDTMRRHLDDAARQLLDEQRAIALAPHPTVALAQAVLTGDQFPGVRIPAEQ